MQYSAAHPNGAAMQARKEKDPGQSLCPHQRPSVLTNIHNICPPNRDFQNS